MVLVNDLIWDGAVLAISLVLLAYLYSVSRVFRGGALSRAFDYFVIALLIACVAFGARVALDLMSVTPDELMVPIRDFAIAVVLLVLLFGLRSASKIWPVALR